MGKGVTEKFNLTQPLQQRHTANYENYVANNIVLSAQ